MLERIEGEMPCKGQGAKTHGNRKASRAVLLPAWDPVPPYEKMESRVGLAEPRDNQTHW